MSNDNLRAAITQTINFLVELLGELEAESADQAEVQVTTDLIQVLER